MFKKILIANRGEIALRILRACRELDIKTVAIHSEADESAIHVKMADESVCVGPASAHLSYLNIPAIITAATLTNVDAIHPGYGFLSESKRFAEIIEEHNIKFIGPTSNHIGIMGNKIKAKKIMRDNGVPIVPGLDDLRDITQINKFIDEIGLPIIIKAASGGGGKGMRVVKSINELEKALDSAKIEAKKSFNNDILYIEKFLLAPKHIEIQILADTHGNVLTLGERDCSIQRKHQKLLEECPSSCLNENERQEISELCKKVIKSIGYEGVGTLEFLYENKKFYFMEMNTRLQVEHPITEMVTQMDLVKEQIFAALGEKIAKNQNDILIKYDMKQGWRGPLKNSHDKLIFSSDFQNSYKNPFPKKWTLSQIIGEDKKFLKIVDKQSNEKNIYFENGNKWLSKVEFQIGDIFFTEKNSEEVLIRQVPVANGGIIVMDPHTGKVLAITGGFSFNLSEFNRATQAKRQPGSAFKPFVYISALKEGFTPSTLILDAPYVVDQGPGLPKWKPSNYTEKFYGINTMRTGLVKSRNLMTIRLSDKVGMKKILNTAKDFKIDKYMDNNLSMSLGAGLVTLQNLTNAYAMIVNGGKEIYPTIIQNVYDKRGNVIINNEQKICFNCIQFDEILNYSLPKIESIDNNILDSAIAYQITSMLEGVVQNGTGKKISTLDVPLAGKTGTTNENKDAWFIGFSPDIVVGVFVGYDKPKSLGYKQTGSAVAVPIFKDFMQKAKINHNKIPFRIPSGISFVKIDPKTGLQTKDDKGILESFIIGTEPFNKNIRILEDLSSINNNSISGTGSLLIN